MTLLILFLTGPAAAAPDPSDAFDWNHINWDAVRASAQTTCDGAIHSRRDLLEVIDMQQQLGNAVARELLRTANVELPLASGTVIGRILVSATEEDVRRLGDAFSQAERAYADEAARITRHTATLEADKLAYQSDRPVGAKARERLVADCAVRVVDAFRWGDEGLSVHREQQAILGAQYAEVVARIARADTTPAPTIPVEPVVPPAAPDATTETTRPDPPAPHVGPSP